MQYRYAYETFPEDGGLAVRCPDLPEVISWATSEGEAQDIAADAVLAALTGYIHLHEDIPVPARHPGMRRIVLPPLVAAKVALYQAMRDQKVTRVALARDLAVSEGAVRKLLNLDQRSHIDLVTRALALLGKTVALDVSDAA